VIIDLERFVRQERGCWKRLENFLDRLEEDPLYRPNLNEALELHYLYQRASSDLARLATYSAEPETRSYLEGLVARAYGELHETQEKRGRFRFRHWFFKTFPQTFRTHFNLFLLAAGMMMGGAAFGGFAISMDQGAREILMPFPHLLMHPSERVAIEEGSSSDPVAGQKATFSSQLMTHNTKVSIFTLALGMTWGIGTLLLLFYNGVILGAVCGDYILAGESLFLAGWLLPHGSIEIPAILIAGQAGLMLAKAMVGHGQRSNLRQRLRQVSGPVVHLIFGVALLLVWAGIIEAFFSQYHAPVVPYGIKIAFGLAQLILLVVYLGWAGSRKTARTEPADAY
jgi:uncharacterized membrane protein SpoIIM required for sporulation